MKQVGLLAILDIAILSYKNSCEFVNIVMLYSVYVKTFFG